jgi:hypothetical protein
MSDEVVGPKGTESVPEKHSGGRRRLLKGLAVTSGATVVAKVVPPEWSAPVAEFAGLPIHAASSGQFTCHVALGFDCFDSQDGIETGPCDEESDQSLFGGPYEVDGGGSITVHNEDDWVYISAEACAPVGERDIPLTLRIDGTNVDYVSDSQLPDATDGIANFDWTNSPSQEEGDWLLTGNDELPNIVTVEVGPENNEPECAVRIELTGGGD